MRGYEQLNTMEADLLWDRERFDKFDDDFFDRLDREIEAQVSDPEPCDLYDKCRDCPNLEECFPEVK